MKVIVNAFSLTSCRIVADLLSFVLFAAISRAFGPAGTGQYSYAFAVGTLVALISTSGFEDYGIREYARAHARERDALWDRMVSTQCVQLALGVLAFLGFVLVGAVHAGNLAVTLELAIYVVGWWMSRTFFVPAMASQSMVGPAVTDLACRLTAIVCALLLNGLVHVSLPWVLAVFPLAGATLLALSLASAARHGARLPPAWSWKRVLSTWRGTLPFAGSDLLNQFYARADVLLIAYFLGETSVGLYATDIKFIEVGLLPLVLLGTAAYPLLSAHAAHNEVVFGSAARDFTHLLFLLNGWLAVGIYCLVPLLIVPLFGASFAPAVPLLPWIALFALLKGGEAVFYRLLYSVHRQTLYCLSLLAGTVLIVCLNLWLIPARGLRGAIWAAILSTIAIDLLAVAGLSRHLGGRVLAAAGARLALALAFTAAVVAGMQRLGMSVWATALAGCGLFPVFAAAAGLLPDPRRSALLRQAAATSNTAAPS